MTHELLVPTHGAEETAGTFQQATAAIAGTTPPVQPHYDVTAHLPVLLVGLRWLFDTEQPAGAVQCPGGDSLPSVGGRGFRFIPSDRAGHAALGIAVAGGIACDAIGGHEVAAFIDLLEGMGEEILSVNVVAARSFCTLTFARPAHPTLRCAVERYRAQHLLRANASPFGPAQHIDAAIAVSAADLYRQAATEKLNKAPSDGPSKPIIYWVDLFDGATTTSTTTSDAERQYAPQS